VRAEKGPPIAGTNDPVTGVLPPPTGIAESSQASVSSLPSSSSSLSVGAESPHKERFYYRSQQIVVIARQTFVSLPHPELSVDTPSFVAISEIRIYQRLDQRQ